MGSEVTLDLDEAALDGRGLDYIPKCAVCRKGLGELSLRGSMKTNYENYKKEWDFRRRKLEAEWEGRRSRKSDEEIVVSATCGDLYHKACLMRHCSKGFSRAKGAEVKKPHCPQCKLQIMYSMHCEIDLDSHRFKQNEFEKRFQKTRLVNQELLLQKEKETEELENITRELDEAKCHLQNARDLQNGLSASIPGSAEEVSMRIKEMREKKREKREMEEYIDKAQRVIEFMQNETPNVMRMYLREVQTRPLDEIPKCTQIPRMLIPYLDKISRDESCLFALSQVLRPQPYPGFNRISNDSLLSNILTKVNPSLHQKLNVYLKELEDCDLQKAYESLFPMNSLKMLESLREIRKSSEISTVEKNSSNSSSAGTEGSDLAITIMYVMDEEDKKPHFDKRNFDKQNFDKLDFDKFNFDKFKRNPCKKQQRPVSSPIHFTVKRATANKFSPVISTKDSLEAFRKRFETETRKKSLKDKTSEETVAEVISDMLRNSIDKLVDNSDVEVSSNNQFIHNDLDEDDTQEEHSNLSQKVSDATVASIYNQYRSVETVQSDSDPNLSNFSSKHTFTVSEPMNPMKTHETIIKTLSGNVLCTLFKDENNNLQSVKTPSEFNVQKEIKIKEEEESKKAMVKDLKELKRRDELKLAAENPKVLMNAVIKPFEENTKSSNTNSNLPYDLNKNSSMTFDPDLMKKVVQNDHINYLAYGRTKETNPIPSKNNKNHTYRVRQEDAFLLSSGWTNSQCERFVGFPKYQTASQMSQGSEASQVSQGVTVSTTTYPKCSTTLLPQSHSTLLSNAEKGRNLNIKTEILAPKIETKFLIECETSRKQFSNNKMCKNKSTRKNFIESQDIQLMDPEKRRALRQRIANLTMNLAPPVRPSSKIVEAVDSLTLIKSKSEKLRSRSNSRPKSSRKRSKSKGILIKSENKNPILKEALIIKNKQKVKSKDKRDSRSTASLKQDSRSKVSLNPESQQLRSTSKSWNIGKRRTPPLACVPTLSASTKIVHAMDSNILTKLRRSDEQNATGGISATELPPPKTAASTSNKKRMQNKRPLDIMLRSAKTLQRLLTPRRRQAPPPVAIPFTAPMAVTSFVIGRPPGVPPRGGVNIVKPIKNKKKNIFSARRKKHE